MKNLGVYVTIVMIAVSGILAYSQTKYKADTTEKIVEKHEVEIEDLEDFSIRQTMLMDRHIQVIEKLEKKL